MLLHQKFARHKLLLASQSPRRRELLKLLNVPFDIRTIDVEEVYPPHLVQYEIPVFLAELKAKAISSQLMPDEIVITADTIVWLEGEQLGKPTDRLDAFNMLSKLSGKMHEVYTGYAIVSPNGSSTDYCQTSVAFKQLTPEEINFYLDSFQPYDKAGSYGIQEWIGGIAVSSINGCYYNIMGLPLHKLHQSLLRFNTL